MNACSRSNCFAPETTCDLGFFDRSNCPSWKGRVESPGGQDEALSDELVLPWSGSALGLVDLGFVAGCKKPLVVGVAGPQNAGKTTLLAAWYLLVGRGLACSEKRKFAGSYSFGGWEAVAGSLRWTPGLLPNFPPHTTSREGRAPGLLHLAFRDADAQPRSYLFADAPGEWFQKWALNRDAVDAEGARWVAGQADVFLLVPRHRGMEGLARTHSRAGMRAGATSNSIERATPGWRRMSCRRSSSTTMR
jgi:hypothetical protein